MSVLIPLLSASSACLLRTQAKATTWSSSRDTKTSKTLYSAHVCRDTSDLVPAVQHRHFQSPHLLTYMIQHYAPTKSSRPPLCLSERSALKLRPSLIGFEVHRLASALYPLSKYAKPRPGPFHPSGLRTPRKGRERKKNGKIRNRNKLPFWKDTN